MTNKIKINNFLSTLLEFTFNLFIICIYIIKCPFNKVEESFNTHAVYDIINKFPNHLPQADLVKNVTENSALTSNDIWDHIVFPGVVPRTFIGALLVGLVMKVPKTLLYNSSNQENQLILQLGSRLFLAILVAISLSHLSNSIQKRFGNYYRICNALVTISQFHYLFYSSRFLPNTFAAILSNLVFASWLNRKFSAALTFIAFSVIIFRFDTCIFFGWLILDALVFKRQLSLWRLFTVGIPTGLVAIAFTVTVDSMMWTRLVWPELESMYFNIWLNKSHEWGTQPFFWYFYACLPKLFLSSLPFMIVAERRVLRDLLLPTIGFLLTYSVMPHKELRFILSVVPVFNLCIASGLINTYKQLNLFFKSRPHISKAIIAAIISSLLLVNVVASLLLLHIASNNYPGGEAGQYLKHDIQESRLNSKKIGVYINNLASQTGFSQFLQLENIYYSKSPQLSKTFPQNYDQAYIILEPKELISFCDEVSSTAQCVLYTQSSKTCSIIKSISSFDSVDTAGIKSFLASFSVPTSDVIGKIIKTKVSLHIIRCSEEN